MSMKKPVAADHVTVLRMLALPEKQVLLDLAKEIAGGPTQFVQRVQTLVNQIDQAGLLAQEKERYAWGVWDGQMPINGVPADVVRSRHDMGDEDGAYWIARDGQIFIFQPVKGIKNAATLASMVEAHVEEIVRETVRWQVAELVERQLLGG
jgi:hypothetical protein